MKTRILLLLVFLSGLTIYGGYKNWGTVAPIGLGVGDALREAFTGKPVYPKAVEVYKPSDDLIKALGKENAALFAATENWKRYNAEKNRAFGRNLTRSIIPWLSNNESKTERR